MRARTILLQGPLFWLLTATSAWASPDLILINGKIFTADRAHPYVEAVAVQDGKFSAVGSSQAMRKLAGPKTQIIDVGGRLITPGLIEAHAHVTAPPPGRLVKLPHLPFPGPSADETLAGVAQGAKDGPGWIWGITGYPVFNDPRNWRDALDRAAPNNPVMLVGCCGHAMMLNSRALEALGVTDSVKDPIGGRWGRDKSGRLDGQPHEAAWILVNRRAAAADPTASIEAAHLLSTATIYAKWGVTSVDQMADEAPLPAIRSALERAHLPIRWTVYAWGLPEFAISDSWREVDGDSGTWPELTRLGGSKWLLDGAPLERGAFQSEDYADRPGWRGQSNYSPAELREILKGALTSRRQLALHVVGDAEAQLVLDAMAEIATPARWRAARVRVEHGDGFFGPRLKQAAMFGLVIVENPIHLDGLILEGGQSMQSTRWGKRAASFQPLRDIVDAGVRLGLASDAQNAEPSGNPFLNIMIAASYRSRPNQALTREEALTAYTAGNAYAEREELRKGRIVPGLAADLAVLSQDILRVPLEALPATTSLLTIVGGRVAFADEPFRNIGR